MKKTTNRNPVKQLFITFPKSNVDKVQFRDALLRFEPDFYKVCEEKHKDGTPHLHAVIRFKNKYSKSAVLKYFQEIYPDDYKRIDVESVRSIKNALTYLSKEDPEPLCSGEYEEHRKPPKADAQLMFARESGFSTVEDCVADYTQRCDEREEILNKVNMTWDWLKNYPDFFPTYRSCKIFENLNSENPIMKDDITFLLKELNIKHELTTRRVF